MSALRDPAVPPRRRRPDVVAARRQLQQIHAAATQVASDVGAVEAGAVSPDVLDAAIATAVANAPLPTDNTDLALALAQIGQRLTDLEAP